MTEPVTPASVKCLVRENRQHCTWGVTTLVHPECHRAALADWLESDEVERTALRRRLGDAIDLGPNVCDDILSTLAAELRR